MKSEVKEAPKKDFFKPGTLVESIHSKKIVLVMEQSESADDDFFKGIVVHSYDGDKELGKLRTWCKFAFKKFEGTLILEND